MKYENAARKESRSIDSDVEDTTGGKGNVANATDALQIATDCLHLKPSKIWAHELGVSDRTVQRWVTGEQLMPYRHAVKVIVKAKGYFMDISRVENAVDEMIMRQFGKMGAL